MESLKFDEGYKEYMINDDPDRVIRINPSDLNMCSAAWMKWRSWGM